jgi:hypothetical protein
VDPGQDLRRFLPRTGHQPLMLEIGRSIQEAIAPMCKVKVILVV